MSNIKSAYIHIPFCKSICSYCDFSKMYYNSNFVNSYLNALSNEIKEDYKGEMLDTIYIGGGTPSALNIDELKRLFLITNTLNLSDNYEFTIECNIEDVTKEKLELFKNNKVNRISIGVQSFNNKILKYLNRKYDSEIILKKINLAKKYFDNINIDLIYAVNGETIEDLKKNLELFLELDIPHISCYSLIIEKNTILYSKNEKYINEDLDRLMYDTIEKILSKKYNHYEISNYSKKGFESKHNLCYWNNKEYYGFGLSAASYIENKRINNTRNLKKYIEFNRDKEEEILTKEDKIRYELILGFRKIKGINKKNFYNKYNIDIHDLYNINELLKKGYLNEDDEYIFIPKEYIYVSNDILINFI